MWMSSSYGKVRWRKGRKSKHENVSGLFDSRTKTTFVLLANCLGRTLGCLFMMGFEGTTINPHIQNLIEEYRLGAVLLKATNFVCKYPSLLCCWFYICHTLYLLFLTVIWLYNGTPELAIVVTKLSQGLFYSSRWASDHPDKRPSDNGA